MAQTEEITKLVGRIEWRADNAPLLAFRKNLEAVTRQLREITTLANKRIKLNFGMGNLQVTGRALQKMSKQQFQDALKHQKLQFNGAQQAIKLDAERNRANVQALRTQGQEQANQHRAQMFNLRREQAEFMRNSRQRIQAARESQQLAAIQQRAHLATQRFQAGMGRLQASPLAQGIRSAGNAVGGGISALLGSAGIAAGGLLSVGAAASAAVLGLKSIADRAAEVSDQTLTRRAQLEVATNGNTEMAKALGDQVYDSINYLGESFETMGPEWVKTIATLSREGLSNRNSLQIMQGLGAYAKTMGVSGERQALVIRGIQQAIGKGQLYSEEWRGQIAESLPGANSMGAQAWARVTGSKATGEEAVQQFRKAMEDGKITGQKLQKFLMNVASTMESSAYAGGLEELIQNNASQAARRSNAMYRSMEETNLANDGELLKSRARFNESLTRLFERMAEINVKMAPITASFNEMSAAAVDGITELTKLFAGEASVFDGMVDEATSRELKELFSNLVETGGAFLDVAGMAVDGWKQLAGLADEKGLLADSLQHINAVLEGIQALRDTLQSIKEGDWSIDLKINGLGLLEKLLTFLPMIPGVNGTTIQSMKNLHQTVEAQAEEERKQKSFQSANPNALPLAAPAFAQAGAKLAQLMATGQQQLNILNQGMAVQFSAEQIKAIQNTLPLIPVTPGAELSRKVQEDSRNDRQSGPAQIDVTVNMPGIKLEVNEATNGEALAEQFASSVSLHVNNSISEMLAAQSAELFDTRV
ncbi:TPA: tape measure protein [Pseudomonas aeruginosa]